MNLYRPGIVLGICLAWTPDLASLNGFSWEDEEQPQKLVVV